MAHPDSLNRREFRRVIEEARSVEDLEEMLRSRVSPGVGGTVEALDPVVDIASQLAPAPEEREVATEEEVVPSKIPCAAEAEPHPGGQDS